MSDATEPPVPPESGPVKVRFLWNADELITGHRVAYHASSSAIVRRLSFIGYLFLVLTGLFLLTRPRMFDVALYPLIPGLLMLCLRPIIVPWNIRRQFARHPEKDAVFVWVFSEDGTETHTPTGDSNRRWSAFSKVLQSREGFLFFTGPRYFQWVPAKGFSSELDYRRVAELAQQHVPSFRRVD